ncbi:Hypothetical predicted protein, partial [Drosophila guanche]
MADPGKNESDRIAGTRSSSSSLERGIARNGNGQNPRQRPQQQQLETDRNRIHPAAAPAQATVDEWSLLGRAQAWITNSMRWLRREAMRRTATTGPTGMGIANEGDGNRPPPGGEDGGRPPPGRIPPSEHEPSTDGNLQTASSSRVGEGESVVDRSETDASIPHRSLPGSIRAMSRFSFRYLMDKTGIKRNTPK